MGGALAIYLAGGLLAILAGREEAPWIPGGGGGNGSYYWFVIASATLIGFVGGCIQGVVEARKAAKRATRAVPLPPYLLGAQWLFSGWRLLIIGVMMAITVSPFALGMSLSELNEETDVEVVREMAIGGAIAAACLAWALVLKGRELRRGKEQIKVADEYLAIREERLQQEYVAMTERLLQEQQEWKAAKTSELYEQILDQQARGVLPCPSCDGRRKSA
ncbi:hypothetical protein [Streptomyces tendae]|uniref:hypothetical protein n=1 Tax=Streptomyces tendae TaxID=1932 RepID=UPI003D74F632